MRLRVLLPLFLFGVLTVVAVLIPAGGSIAQSRTQQVQLQRSGAIDQILQRSYAALETGDAAALEYYLDRFSDTYDEAVLVVDAAGETVAASGPLSRRGEAAAALGAALLGVPQGTLPTVYPWSDRTAILAEPVAVDGGAPEGAVALEVDLGPARNDVRAGWAIVGAAGVALLSALLTASVLWTRWIVRPVLALDAAANALAERREVEPAHASGPPELRRLARSFDRMARRVEHVLEQQRGLVADASHQLRNPLAAVRLRIDALLPHGTGEPGDPGDEAPVEISAPELAAIAHDLDRLERTVERMLVLANAEHRAAVARSGRDDGTRDPEARRCTASAAALIEPYRERLREAGVDVVTFGPAAQVDCHPGDLEEIVEIVVDNTRKYAAGSTLSIGFEVAPDGVALVMSDSGPGLADEEFAKVGTRFWRSDGHRDRPGTGLGYAIIDQLARANRGGLAVDRAPEGGLRTRIALRGSL